MNELCNFNLCKSVKYRCKILGMTVPLGNIINDTIMFGRENAQGDAVNQYSQENQNQNFQNQNFNENLQNYGPPNECSYPDSNADNGSQNVEEKEENNENISYDQNDENQEQDHDVAPPKIEQVTRSPRLAKYHVDDDQISDYSDQTSQTTQTTQTNQPEQDPRMEQVEDIINYGHMPPDDERDSVYEYVTEQMKESCKSRNYKRAAYFQIALDKLNEKPPAKVIIDSNREKIEHAHKQIQLINEKYDQLIQHKNAEIHSLTSQLQANIDKEEQEYEEKCSSPEYIQQYAKPSKELLSLRKIENKYAQAGLWAEADATKTRADSMERKETQAAREKAVENMRIGYETMKARHQKQLDGMEDYRKREINALEMKRQKELNHWNMYMKRSDVINPTVRKSDTILYTPRQVRYPVHAGTCTLNVGTINFKQYVRIRPNTSRRSPRTPRRL